MLEVAIVGGGLAGLTAGYFLSQKGQKVTIFEKENQLGGLASTFKGGEWLWPLERYYHHFFASDQEIFSLLKKLGLKEKLVFKKPKTAVFLEGKIFRFDNPLSVLLFPRLGMADKLRTGLTVLFLKLNPFWRPLERITAADFINKTMGKRTYGLIWKPLLESKFGPFAENIPASWFWTRIKKRSFALGYLEGGNEILIKTLAEKIKKNGGKIFLNQRITKIKKEADGFTIQPASGSLQKFDRVVAAVSPKVFSEMVPDLSETEKEKIRSLTSLGSLNLVMALKQSFLTDGTYWLNINDGSFPFLAVVEHTNFIEKKFYQNQTVLYVGGYYPANHRFFKMTKEQVFREFLPYLKKINPAFNFELLTLNFELFKDAYSQPVVGLNYSRHLPETKTSTDGLYWASLHHVYPEDRGINYAVLLGRKIADEIDIS